MFRISLTTLLLLFFTFNVAVSQNVNIPDPAFKSILVSNTSINTNADSEISVAEASAFNGTIYVNDPTITSLVGIEAFTSLSQLSVSNTGVTTLDISAITNLNTLYLSYNALTNLNISTLTNLYELTIEGEDQLTNLSMAAAANVTNMFLDFSGFTSLNMAQHTNLLVFSCQGCPVSSINLTQNVNVTNVNVSQTMISNLDFSANPALQKLSVGDYTNLDISQNNNLTDLTISNNNLTTIDIANNVGLTSLSLFNMPNLSSLNIFSNSALENIFIASSTSLNNLEINNHPSLVALTVWTGILDSIDVSLCPALERLLLNDNNLTSIDLSSNPNLGSVALHGNNLDTLDVSNNPMLYYVGINDNNVRYLDLSNNPLLDKVYAQNNNLVYLDLRNGDNASLQDINLIGNPGLTCVNADDPVLLASSFVGKYDTTTSFSEDCNCSGGMEIIADSLANVSCADSGLISMQVNNGIAPFNYSWVPSVPNTGSMARPDSAGTYTISITDSNLCKRTKSFVLDGPLSMSQFDLSANLITSLFRPDFSTPVWVDVYNKGCAATSGQLKVSFYESGKISFDSASITPDSILGNTLIWDFTNLDFETASFTPILYFKTDSMATSQDWICFDIRITPSAGDLNVDNNARYFCFNVGNSYDPNDKKVAPAGSCDEHFTALGESLVYTIRFQNTGSAAANDVVLVDTLSKWLDVNTIEILSKSDEITSIEVLEDSIVEISFNGINLPDSLSDPLGSQGYVVFSVDPVSNINSGVKIENDVAIYFDFNPPIITNSVFNTMVDTVPEPVTTYINKVDCYDYTLNGVTYSETGNYTQYFTASTGCDSLVQLDLVIGPKKTIMDVEACVEYEYNGQFYDSSQIILDTLTAARGCDSILEINLVIQYYFTTLENVEIAPGDSIFAGGAWQTDVGEYRDTIVSTTGDCDEIVVTNLTIVNGIGKVATSGSNTIKIAPNPAKGHFFVTYSNLRMSGNSTFSMMNASGQQVIIHELDQSQQRYVFDISSLPTGLYYYQVVNSGGEPESAGKLNVRR